MTDCETIEQLILRHSRRGMDILEPYMEKDFCRKSAEALWNLERGIVFLTTGFYVAGFAETDGPPGTACLAEALRRLGFRPVIVTDKYCRGFFDADQTEVLYIEEDAKDTVFAGILERYQPVALVSVERCGKNSRGDYANMSGVSIREYTAPVDRMFEMAAEQHIPTFGVGDGGNEIGMGCLEEVIEDRLSLVPCCVPVDYLVIATVSNWGAYGITAALEILSGESLLPCRDEAEAYLNKIVDLGSVDGVTKEHVPTVDGYPAETENEILDGLREIVKNWGGKNENI